MSGIIKRLRELEAAATPGPWRWYDENDKSWCDIVGRAKDGCWDAVIQRDHGVYPPDIPTGDLIIEMRNNIKPILDRLEFLEKFYEEQTQKS